MGDRIDIESSRHVYFLGIGGIGMSAVARYLNFKGLKVSGYDRDENELTKKLEAEGMVIHYEDDVLLIPKDIDVIIYTPAIPHDQSEYVYLKNSGIPMLKRSEALKAILHDKKVIAVAGTHGKTSTSAMIAHVLHSQGFPASAFIGGILKNYDSNFIFGDSDWVVLEADEYDRSFLRLYPTIAVVQAMDADHLDIYGDKSQIVQSFKDFTLQVQEQGTLYVREGISEFWGQKEWRDALGARDIELQSFGYGCDSCQVTSRSLVQKEGKTTFEICVGSQSVPCSLSMPGLHNVINATAAAAVAWQLGLSLEQISDGLATFSGIQRRFEMIHSSEDIIIIDDYAHHPVEIEAAINATRGHYADRKLTVVFQPHLFTRTRDFKDGFASSLDMADEVILLDIYPARELPIEGVDSGMIKNLMTIKDKKWLSKEEMIQHLNKEEIEVLLILGAGDINKLIPRIKSKLT